MALERNIYARTSRFHAPRNGILFEDYNIYIFEIIVKVQHFAKSF